MIKARNVNKSFGDYKALDGLSLNVEKGSVYGLIGPNGAGKTTFIKTLMGIYRTNGGEILVDGEQIYENAQKKQEMIYVSDDLYFFPAYTIEDTAKFYSGIYPNWNWETFESLKAIFKIDVKRKPRRLSKGMQKQVAFWLGLCAEPKIMVLDEPIDGLDPVMRRNTWSLVLQKVAENGMTFRATISVSLRTYATTSELCLTEK